jgi:hypothetical protein
LGAEKKLVAVKDDYFIVQVIENKKKESTEGKTDKIKQRLMLSDGTSNIIAMVTQ